MKRIKLKISSIWNLLFAKEWLIYTKDKSGSYTCECMVVADVMGYCIDKYSHHYNDVIDRTQQDINLKEANKIINS